MDIEVRHLRYFVAVAEELSFTAAAARLHMAQPPLSRAVKRLEAELGTKLFDRSTRSVELTEAGAVLLDASREAIRAFEDALARTSQAGRVGNRQLRIGFRPASSLPLLEPIVREFKSQNQHMTVEAHRIEWTDQISCLLSGQVDIAFVLHPLSAPGVIITPLLAAPRAVAMPRDHPLASRTAVSIDELSDYALAVPSGAGPPWQEFWTASTRSLSASAPSAPVVANADESLAAVLSGGAFVLAISTVKSYYGNESLAIVPIEDIAPAVIGLARLENGRDDIESFVSIAEEMASEVARSLAEQLQTNVVGPDLFPALDLSLPLRAQLDA